MNVSYTHQVAHPIGGLKDLCNNRVYTLRTSNFGSALGGAGMLGKGFASMELA